jgi:hypothetical protein
LAAAAARDGARWAVAVDSGGTRWAWEATAGGGAAVLRPRPICVQLGWLLCSMRDVTTSIVPSSGFYLLLQ